MPGPAPLVIGMGRIGVAIAALAPNLPTADSPAAALVGLAATPGAGIAIALRAALRLGCRARAVGTHGADLLGQLARSAVKDAGIEGDLLAASGASACELVTVGSEGTTRTRFAGDRGEPVTHDYVRALAGATACLIDGSSPVEQHALATAARAHHVPVILHLGPQASNADELHGGAAGLIPASDILIATETCASELAPRGELGDALAELIALGPRAVVITLGDKGAIGRHGEQVVRCSPFATEALDGFGAASVFHGAFAAALLSELPFGRCIELASAAASLSLRELGPWSALPNRDEVLALVRSRRAA